MFSNLIAIIMHALMCGTSCQDVAVKYLTPIRVASARHQFYR